MDHEQHEKHQASVIANIVQDYIREYTTKKKEITTLQLIGEYRQHKVVSTQHVAMLAALYDLEQHLKKSIRDGQKASMKILKGGEHG